MTKTEENINENFLMPGEWEHHFATWLTWPNDDDYFEDKIEDIKNTYIKIIFTLHKGEMIKLLVLNKEKESEVKNLLEKAGIDLSKIIFYQTEYVDIWMRDYGPTFVKSDNYIFWIKWNYDGYGGKFPELLPDDKVFLNLKKNTNHKMIKIDIALEGGAIDSNGKGSVLTTEECLLLNRNHGKTKEEYNELLNKSIGAKNIIWLNKGLVNDHTDGHIDEVARFVSSNKILCSYEDDISDENNERLKENYEILKNAVDQDGKNFEIIKLPMPHMNYEEGDKGHNGKKAPVSYANFYIGNKVVLMSVFNDPNDEKAKEIIQSCFPDKEIVSIDCRSLIYGGGAIHCITQQEFD